MNETYGYQEICICGALPRIRAVGAVDAGLTVEALVLEGTGSRDFPVTKRPVWKGIRSSSFAVASRSRDKTWRGPMVVPSYLTR
jgi:hypothetical protein